MPAARAASMKGLADDAQRDRAQGPCRRRREQDREREDHVVDRLSHRGHERQRQDDRRQRHHAVDDALARRVRDAAVVAGEDAPQRPDGDPHEHRRQAHVEREPRAPDHPAQHVAPEVVGAHRKLAPGRHELAEDGVLRAVRRQHRGEEGRDHQPQHDHRPRHAERLAAQQSARLHAGGAHASRIRGSSHAYSRSTMRLSVRKISAITNTIACTVG